MSTTPKRLRGYHLVNDETWKERLQQINQNTAEILAAKGVDPTVIGIDLAVVGKDKTTVVAVSSLGLGIERTVVECDPDCLICKGNGYYLDHTESAIECPKLREKINKLSRGK